MDGTASHSDTALLSIGEVVAAVRHRFPDMSHSSLRFLEREGLIAPDRTPGGHRLYTRAHLDRILQIKTWQAERFSLEQIRHRLDRLDQLPPSTTLTATFLRQAIEGDRVGASRTIMSADEVGMSLLRLFAEVLQPALVEVGLRWERGEVAVAQEKEISELVRELITELTIRHTPSQTSGPVIVAACIEGERHELGLRMVCGLLRARGYHIHFLGADVAPRFLSEAARLRQPDAILLSVTLDAYLHAVRDAMAALASTLSGSGTVLVGGEAARHHADQVRAWGAAPIICAGLEDELGAVMAAVPITHDPLVSAGNA